MLVEAILKALELGYRHIDTAQFYDNEAEVGRALGASGLSRDEVFLTTKVWYDRLAPSALIESAKHSLELLGIETVDLLLIHWPSPDNQVVMEDYLGVLRDVQRAGKTRHIGVSNFTISQLDRAVAILGDGVEPIRLRYILFCRIEGSFHIAMTWASRFQQLYRWPGEKLCGSQL